MDVPQIVVVGRASREVIPDRALVRVSIKTAVSPTPQVALALCADSRRRLVDHLAVACPGARITDGRVTTNEETRQVETQGVAQTERRWEVYGHTGHAVIALEDEAGAAAAIVAQAGTHPDASTVLPGFTVGAELERRTAGELEREAVRDALARAGGLAEAAGLALGAVIAVEEPSAPDERPWPDTARSFSAASAESSADDVQEALGELRPEPVSRSAQMIVRIALVTP